MSGAVLIFLERPAELRPIRTSFVYSVEIGR
jgi:hypothetical protein